MKKNLFVFNLVFLLIFFGCNFDAKAISLSEKERSVLYNQSIVSRGNNYRLKSVLGKIARGEEVRVAAIGGSITEGEGAGDFKDGYAYQFFRQLKNFSPDGGKNLYFNGAGLCGTPSVLGLIRYKRDVLDVTGRAPDLLIVEFAVNDGVGKDYERAFEALVKNALEANSLTAVIVLYSAYDKGNVEKQMKPIADYYQLPQISIMRVVEKAFSEGYFTRNQFYADYIHPTKSGHALMADCLMNLCRYSDSSNYDEIFSVPQDCLIENQKSFVNMKMLDHDDSRIDKGDFTGTDLKCQKFFKTRDIAFKENWYCSSNSDGKSFKVNLECSSFILVYKCQRAKENEKFGIADIYIDDKLWGKIDGEPIGSWNNALFKVLIDEQTVKNHSIEIRPEKQKGFTILMIGYAD